MPKGVMLLLIFGSVCVDVSQQSQAQITSSRATILVTASNETDTATRTTGAATVVGRVAVGTAGANTSTYEHSEVWEVVRRFNEGCPAATFVTNPETPHSLTIHTDYEKVSGGLLMGTVVLYQLVLLDHANNPLYVSKKNWLRREIKPICKIIQKQ
jgi:hypothetical protein